MPSLNCPHCRQNLEVQAVPAAGTMVRCFLCNVPFQVAPVSKTPPAPKRPSLPVATPLQAKPRESIPAANAVPASGQAPALSPALPPSGPTPASPFTTGSPLDALGPATNFPGAQPPISKSSSSIPLLIVGSVGWGVAVLGLIFIAVRFWSTESGNPSQRQSSTPVAAAAPNSQTAPSSPSPPLPPGQQATPPRSAPGVTPSAPPPPPKVERLLYQFPASGASYNLQVDISGPAFINFRADTTFRFLEMNAENQAKASGKASGIDFAKSKFVEAQFAGLLGSSTRTTGVVSEQGQYFPLETDRTLLSGMTVPHTIFDELPAGSLLNWLTAGATSKWSCTRRGEMPVQNVVGEGNNRRLSETLVPISHRVTYHCGEKKGNLQTIHKTFETDSVTTPNGNYVAKGTGTSVFDLSKGLPIKGEMTAEVKQVVRGTPREATVKVTYELRQ